MQTRKWQDQSGADRYTTEIVLDTFSGQIELLSPKSGDREPTAHDTAKQDAYQPQQQVAELDDEIPF